MVVASSPAGKLDIVIGYGAMVAVMLATAIVLIIASLAESYIKPRVTLVFSQITAIIPAALSIQYIIDGLQALRAIQISGWSAVTLSSGLRLFVWLGEQPFRQVI